MRIRRIVVTAALCLVCAPVVLILAYRVIDPPITPLMLIRLTEGEGLERQSVSLDAVSPYLRRAVIASEDNLFCHHGGFDWKALQEQIFTLTDGETPRGASTITMQTAKNVFLWPGRDYVRKLLEVPLTALIELTWPKSRILEVYLNVMETGPGVYGAQAASRAYFARDAADLVEFQAALIATSLPNPRVRRPDRPSRSHLSRAKTVERRIARLGPNYFSCVVDP